MRQRPTPCEQAVYGNFPFWNRGYAILARSANCRPEWLSALKPACQRFGERPRDSVEARGIFAIPLPHGPCMIVGVFPNGRDDQGRPGALVFHARFIPARAFRKSGYNPFAFTAGLSGDWSVRDVDSVLPPGLLITDSSEPSEPAEEETVSGIVRAIVNRKRVVVPSARPIDDLARGVWSRLPARARARASFATFAYDNGNQFDLVALPGQRAAGLAQARDPSCLIVDLGDSATAFTADITVQPNRGDTQQATMSQRSVMNQSIRPRFLGRILRSILPLMVLIGVLGCAGGKEVTPEAVKSARAVWEKAGIKDYDLELKIVSPTGHYRSTVRDGKVLKVESIQPDGRLLEAHPGDPRFYSVNGQFTNMVEEIALSQSAEPFGQPKGTKVVMRFDPDAELGYPHWYRRDVFGTNRSVAIDIVKLEPSKASP